MAIRNKDQWAKFFRVDEATFEQELARIKHSRTGEDREGIKLTGYATRILKYRIGKLRRGERAATTPAPGSGPFKPARS